jgi:environmental stress-induced protein Ves
MRTSIFNPEKFKSTKWSGGTTTELCIYPESAQYSERNFGFRISTATVETETSTFTPLPGYERNLMVLSGEMTLTINGELKEPLSKFDVETFDGSWDTQSSGTCKDFNLMTHPDYDGDVCGLSLTKSELLQIELEDEADWLFIYNLQHPITLIVGNKNFELAPGQFLQIEEVDFDEFTLYSQEDAECVLTVIARAEA